MIRFILLCGAIFCEIMAIITLVRLLYEEGEFDRFFNLFKRK